MGSNDGAPAAETTEPSDASITPQEDKRDMCLCGLLSLSLSVHLICCIEVFFSMILMLQAPDLLTMDGTYFYFLGNFEGGGTLLFFVHISMCLSCITSGLLLICGSRSKRPLLLIPHLAWQLCYILFAFSVSLYLILLGRAGKMLMASSIVLAAMLSIPGLAECWWSYLTFCYFHQLRRKCRTYEQHRQMARIFSAVPASTA